MSTTDRSSDQLVNDYLHRLEQASAALPATDRQELLEQIRDHIEATRTHPEADQPAHMQRVLADLGTPEEIVAAAHAETGTATPGFARPAPTAGRELLAVWLLGAGIFLFFIGWLVGLMVAWSSKRWNWRQKLAASLLPVPPIWTILIAHSVGRPVIGLPIILVGFAVSALIGRKLYLAALEKASQ